MGTVHEELQASVELIWEYADAACKPGSELRPDIEYGKRLLLASPDLLDACQAALDWLDHTTDGGTVTALLRQVIAKATT